MAQSVVVWRARGKLWLPANAVTAQLEESKRKWKKGKKKRQKRDKRASCAPKH